MSARADVPWALLAEATVKYAGERAIELELAPGVRARFAPPEGLTKSDYDFFGIEGWDDELLTPAPLVVPWFHEKREEPPPNFRFGPLHGTQRELAALICPGKRVDTRRFQSKAGTGASIWVRKQHRTHYEVWFRHEGEYMKATGKTYADTP
jgi:hypothetical protein